MYNAVDLFSGCGGLSEGMRQAGFNIRVAIDIDNNAVYTYRVNHPNTTIIERDIRLINGSDIRNILEDQPIHLLAGCPPCQGFSSVRRLNKKRSVRDSRNSLVLDYYRFIEELRPYTIMLENVPGLSNYYLFQDIINNLTNLGYDLKIDTVDVQQYGIPQRRKRLIMVGSRLGNIDIAPPTNERRSVRDAIGDLLTTDETTDPLHKVMTKHTTRIKHMIKLIPKNGGSRKSLPEKYQLQCHKKSNVGFNDIYGRLAWDDCAPTITGGCLNPSKGRFLHPEENRVITPREASLLQSFPADYWFPIDIAKNSLSNMIGEALPPKFSSIQCSNIKNHLDNYFGR